MKGRKANPMSTRGHELEITGQLLLPDALPGWELELILPAITRLLTPAVRGPDAEETVHAQPS